MTIVVDKCGVCGSQRLEHVLARYVKPGDSWYGWQCQDCYAYLDSESGKTEWEMGRRSQRAKLS